MTSEAGETIRLDQFMKFVGLARSGGQAKHMIQNGEVRVNGEVETRRSRKLREGDLVTIGDQTVEVRLGDSLNSQVGRDAQWKFLL